MEHPWDRRLGFWWIAEDHPEELAVLASPDGTRSYGELAGDAHQLVHLFRSLGATAGDTIAVLVDNGITIIETSLATQEGGYYFTPLNSHLTAAELAAIMEHSGTKVLIVGDRFVPLLVGLDREALGLAVFTVGEVEGETSLVDARAAHPRTEPTDRRPGGLFVYTSGTTGTPKGIRRPLPEGDVGQVANDAALFGRAFDFRPFEGPMLVSTGMFHGGSHSYFMGGLNVGHALVVMPRFDPEETLRLIQEWKIRTAYMVPTQFHRLLRLPDHVRAAYDTSSLHAVVHSAAPCPRPVKERLMEWWGPVVWETYGGMEGAATIAKPYRWLEKPGTVGRAVNGVNLFILDDDGTELGPGEVGNIYMENELGFRYHKDPEQTEKAFQGRRFSLGDIGHLDEDGYLFISDRAKDMIITGGTNVYPAEVEATLLEHPKVRDVGVIGVPDPDWGETVTALVQVNAGVVTDDELIEELTAFCRERLASYKCPRRWDFRDDLPRTEAGKLYKRRIRDEYVAAESST